MNWVFISVVSYFLNAVVAVVDKFLISKKIPAPISYAFYAGILSAFVIVLIPFGFFVPSIDIIFVSLVSGGVFLVALILFFKGLFENEASRITTTIGAFLPIFSLLLGFLIVNEKLNASEFLSLALLIVGGVLISSKFNKSFSSRILFLSVCSAALFALSYVLAKFVYMNGPFLNGFIWTRFGTVFVSVFLLASPQNRRMIFKSGKESGSNTGLLFVGNKALSAVAFLMLNFALVSGAVSLVNALEGSKYVFIFAFTLILSQKFPNILKEDISKKIILQKIFAIILIVIGLVLLA